MKGEEGVYSVSSRNNVWQYIYQVEKDVSEIFVHTLKTSPRLANEVMAGENLVSK